MANGRESVRAMNAGRAVERLGGTIIRGGKRVRALRNRFDE